MSDDFELPERGFVFWPVGCGDSSTIVVSDRVVFQLDLRHMERSEDDDDPAWPVIDELVRLLPRKNGKPYLSVFALTHPDQDHIAGFEELLRRVVIGEIWHTPRIFRDYEKHLPLCEAAKAFRKEAHRRRRKMTETGGNAAAGDRLRVVGYDELFEEDDYKDFPRDYLTVPGSVVTELDGEDISTDFEAFVHAPFKDDMAESRNNTSLALQITLKDGASLASALFFGDREYLTVKQVFEVSKQQGNADKCEWDILLAPHHCSKKVMHWADEGEEKERFRADVMDLLQEHARPGAHIIASANDSFSDGEGDLPPHGRARRRYQEIIDADCFICTHTHPDKNDPAPVKFELKPSGLALAKALVAGASQLSLRTAVEAARGGKAPPQQQVGFG